MKLFFPATIAALLLLLFRTADAQLLRRPATQTQPTRFYENVWKPDFLILTDTSPQVKAHVAIPLFGNISSPRLFNFYGELSIGTPPQKFKVVFEASESALWIPNFQASASQHAFYDHTKSSSYQANSVGYLSYASYYSLYGFLSRDSVHIGDCTLANTLFVEATQVTDPSNFADLDVDGMLGLAPPSLEDNHVVKRLLSSGAADEPVFAFYFHKKNDINKMKEKTKTERLAEPANAGELTIGAIDKRRYTGNIHYVDSVSNMWAVELEAVTVSNSSYAKAKTGEVAAHALISPSWPYIAGPSDEINKLAKAVGVTDGGAVDCSSEGPDIVLHIGGVKYTLSKDDYTRQVAAGIGGEDEEQERGNCHWVFEEIDIGVWWIGQPFLQKFYTVFEFGSEHDNKAPRIGFALAT